MTDKLKSRLTGPLAISIALHGILLSLLIFQMTTTPSNKPQQLQVQAQPQIINAISVDQAAVERSMVNIKRERQARENAARRKQQQTQRRLAKLRKQLQKVQAEQKQIQKQAKKRLEKIKKQSELAAKKLKAQQAKAAAAAKTAKIAKAKTQAKAKAKVKQATTVSTAQQSEVSKYSQLIKQAIAQQWLVPNGVSKTLSCQLRIRLAPDGTVLRVSLARSSGNAVLDRSAMNAVRKASPLPVPEDKKLFERFREIALTVRPEGFLS